MTEPYDPNPPVEFPVYQPGYQPGYQPPAFAAPPPGYLSYGQPLPGGFAVPYPGYANGDRRPGLVAAAAVLAFVEAALLVAAGLLLLLGASFVNALSTDLTSEDHDTVVWLAFAGLADLVMAAAAVAAGMLLLNRRAAGRWWVGAAALADLICAIIWLTNSAATFVLALLLAAPLVVGAVLAWTRPVTRWLSTAASHPGTFSTS
jgi:hypothetical protein